MALTKVNGQMLDGAITVDSSGNLNFTGTAQRITGDFSNATISNRVFFQNSTTDNVTVVGVIPSGTATQANLEVYNKSDPNGSNSPSMGQLIINSTEYSIRSAVRGSGTYLPMTFQTGGSERMRIDSSGNLLVGTTSASYGARNVVQNNGTTTQPSISCINSTGSGTMRQIDFFTGSNTSRIGSIESTTSSTSYNTSSDYRLKNSIAPMTGALEKVSALRPVTYKWNIDNSDGQGFIAHELQAIVPDCVSGDKDAVDANGNPQYQGIDTSFLVATLTAAIQELKATVDAQAVRITALEGAAV